MDLPPELRNRIYETLFFGNGGGDIQIQPQEYLLRHHRWSYGIEMPDAVHTASRQIHPYYQPQSYHVNRKSQRRFPLAIFRASHAIQAESEPQFYSLASFNLMGFRFSGVVESWQFLSELSRRYRKMIRRVEHLCFNSFSEPSSIFYTHQRHCSFSWMLFMKMLVQECSALQSLKLWIYHDEVEKNWVAKAKEADGWVQAILHLENLQNMRHFDMLVMRTETPAVLNNSAPPFTVDILPWLQARLIGEKRPSALTETALCTLPTPAQFPFLGLPSAIRARIYRFTLLPDNKQICPYIKPWYDETTRNVTPLLMVCRDVRREAEDVLYGEAIFRVPDRE